MHIGFHDVADLMDWPTRKALDRWQERPRHPTLLAGPEDDCFLLCAWEPGFHAEVGFGSRIALYNHQLPHAVPSGRLPTEVRCSASQADQQAQEAAMRQHHEIALIKCARAVDSRKATFGRFSSADSSSTTDDQSLKTRLRPDPVQDKSAHLARRGPLA